jgi:amino acid transporter
MAVNLFQLFKASLMEPKKQAAVRILTIGKILRYVFAFILFMVLVSFVELAFGLSNTATDTEALLQYIEEIEWLLYPFALVFLFVTTTLYHFAKISIFAFVALGLLRFRKRRGEYRHVWRTAALSVTVPTLISFAASFFTVNLWVTAATNILTVVYLYLAIGYYPKMPPARKKNA